MLFFTFHVAFFLVQEPQNEYSHLDPAPPSAAVAAAAVQQGEAANLEDEELLRALQQTEEIGELEATDLMQFAYQIASGMVLTAACHCSVHVSHGPPCSSQGYAPTCIYSN